MDWSFCLDGKQGKTKRIRTTFTEEQLQILQANFEVDSNPDGQDLERIAQITGNTNKFENLIITKIFIIERAINLRICHLLLHWLSDQEVGTIEFAGCDKNSRRSNRV